MVEGPSAGRQFCHIVQGDNSIFHYLDHHTTPYTQDFHLSRSGFVTRAFPRSRVSLLTHFRALPTLLELLAGLVTGLFTSMALPGVSAFSPGHPHSTPSEFNTLVRC